jgi:hypothetical protein
MAVTGAFEQKKKDLKTLHPMSHIHPVAARPAIEW